MNFRHVLAVLAVAGMAILLFLPADVTGAPLSGLDNTCLETELKGCSVLSSGYIAAEQGPRIAFQTQAGFTDADGVRGGVVLFEKSPDGWEPFASAFDGYRYDVPRLVEHDQTLLHVAGYTGGTGAYNADLLFIWGDLGHADYREGWRPIDTGSWRNTIGDLLPESLEIWQGVDYDFDDWFYNRIEACTPLWRAEDGNCCPSGGWAIIHFAIEHDALVATGIDYQQPAKTK
jgi:hypothetical protein